jgi:integrase
MFQPNSPFREAYRYGVYRHRLLAPDGSVYARPFIVIRNGLDVIVRFTNLHNYVSVFDGKVFLPLVSDAEKKLYYVCKMLNYVLIEHYEEFGIDDALQIDRAALDAFFRDYALEAKPDGGFRGAQSIEKCVAAVVTFFRNLRRKFGGRMLLANSDLVTEKLIRTKRGDIVSKSVPAFQVRGIPSRNETFRELPTKAFKILLNLAFRYATDIVFAMCLQAFAGLRAGEVCNVRQESSPLGGGVVFTRIGDDIRKIEIDLTRKISLRSDGVETGSIKKKRVQCVYPPFLDAFILAYDFYCKHLSSKPFETDYCPMFINNRNKAMTYNDYSRRFDTLVKTHFRPALLESGDPECKLYGQLLYENDLTPHALRHWFSVQLVLHGEDIAQIQYWRGDKSPESAFVYLQNKGDLVRELERTSADFINIALAYGYRKANDLKWIR